MALRRTRYPQQGRDILAFEIGEGDAPRGSRTLAWAQVVVGDEGNPLGTPDNPLIVNDVGAAPDTSSPLTSRDVWGRQIAVAPYRLAELVWTYDVDGRSRVTETGTGSVDTVDGSLTLSVQADGDVARLRSKRHPAYQANRGHVLSTATQGIVTDDAVTWRMGTFTDRYGVFFEVTGGRVYAVRRNTTGNTAPGPEDWTPGGGTTIDERVEITSALAALGINDVTVNRLWDIRYQWRGSGNIEFYVDQLLVHVFERLGVSAGLSIAVPSLPFRVELVADGTPGAARSVAMGCVDVSSEGGTTPETRPVVLTKEATGAGISSEAPWLAVKSAPNVRGLAHCHDLWPQSFSGIADNETVVKVYRTTEAGITGGTWAASPQTDGVLVREPTGLGAASTRTLVAVGFLSDNDSDPASPALDLSGVGFLSPDEGAAGPATDDGDVLLITLQTLGGSVNDLFTAINVREEL